MGHLDNQVQSWLIDTLKEISQLRKEQLGRLPHVVFYASSFLQKPEQFASSMISSEDVNGMMNAFYGVKEKFLTLILHTPGGDVHAVESIVDYLHSKYKHIEVIVPAFAMSGGAMISLASDHLIMSKAGQLGPFDPQILRGGDIYSARAIQEGFARATQEIQENEKMVHVWAPILHSMGPSLLMDAEKSLSYSKEQVSRWLLRRKSLLGEISDDAEREKKAEEVTAYFNAEPSKKHGQIHLHGQRIGLEKLEKMKLNVEALEGSQPLQEQVMTAYHLMTIAFERGTAFKFIASSINPPWSKNP